MALPKIDVPTYDLSLPSNGKKISYRPFLVKEEKLILMAAVSNDESEIKRTIKQVVNNCIVSGEFDVEEAPVFDVEYILMNIRIKSIGDTIKNQYVCNNVVDEKKCGNEFTVNIHLNEIETVKEDVKDEIWLTKDVGVKMRWPKFSSVKNKSDSFDYELITNCIEYVFDKQQTYKLKEQSKKEIEEFFDGLSKEQFDKITDYLKKIPRFEVHKTHKCEKCGFNHNIDIKDMLSFF